ncbi:PIN domain-containing protein [Rhodopila globiformis]|uniref:PIN domain-containing protein n=1 Tax=Rhodopila globiformis TaxID=1071 RepID=UPI0011B0BB58|nr:PIN domain-containing protein [Rhodopila globiformis]
MSDDAFTLDTNILLHSVDRDAGHRHEIAGSILRGARRLPCYLTLQSISELPLVGFRGGRVRRSTVPQSNRNRVEKVHDNALSDDVRPRWGNSPAAFAFICGSISALEQHICVGTSLPPPG